jgi:hypothetical protein
LFDTVSPLGRQGLEDRSVRAGRASFGARRNAPSCSTGCAPTSWQADVDHLGDHLQLAYYARTTSGSEWEIGWNPIVVDETTWEPATHQGISVWGHKPVGQTVVDRLDQFRLGARSLVRPEVTVRALSEPGIPDG